MRDNKYINYIESGLGIPPNGREFRKIALGPCLFVLLCGLIPCVVLRGNWLILLSVMLATSFSITTAVFVISFKPLSLVSRLVMQSLIYSNFVMQLLLLEAMFYIITWGIDYGLIPLLLVPLLTPFIIGVTNSKKLSKNQTIFGKKTPCTLVFICMDWYFGNAYSKNIFIPNVTKVGNGFCNIRFYSIIVYFRGRSAILSKTLLF